MKRSALVLAPTVACLMLAVFVTASSAKDNAGMSSNSPVVQGPASPSADSPMGCMMGRRHHGATLEDMMKKLGITDDQKLKIRALYVGFLDRTRKTRMDLKSLKDEKKTMLLSGKIDQQKLAQIDDQVVKLVGDLLKEKLKLRRDRLAALTPEQIGRIADWQAEKAFRSKLRRMHGEGMHHHGW